MPVMMAASDDPALAARRALRLLSGLVARAERGALTGRNHRATRQAARAHLTAALTAICALEDANGVTAAAGLADRASRLRERATDVGVLTFEDVAAAEAAAVS